MLLLGYDFAIAGQPPRKIAVVAENKHGRDFSFFNMPVEAQISEAQQRPPLLKSGINHNHQHIEDFITNRNMASFASSSN